MFHIQWHSLDWSNLISHLQLQRTSWAFQASAAYRFTLKLNSFVVNVCLLVLTRCITCIILPRCLSTPGPWWSPRPSWHYRTERHCGSSWPERRAWDAGTFWTSGVYCFFEQPGLISATMWCIDLHKCCCIIKCLRSILGPTGKTRISRTAWGKRTPRTSWSPRC